MDFDVIVGTGCPYRQASLLCAVRYKMENSNKIMSINICISTNPQYKFVMYSRTVREAGPYKRTPEILHVNNHLRSLEILQTRHHTHGVILRNLCKLPSAHRQTLRTVILEGNALPDRISSQT